MQVNTSVNTSMSSLLARITSKNTHTSVGPFVGFTDPRKITRDFASRIS